MTALALGCSHTAGLGVLPAECYVSLLADYYNITIKNHAVPGGNADQVVEKLITYMRKNSPNLVIVQWPNPFRRTIWHGGRAIKENVNNASDAFNSLLTASKENFMQPWIKNIITVDTLCKLAAVPIVHILLEDLDTEYVTALESESIQLHRDLKLPGQTWLFDSSGSDGMHHSAGCHAQWAKRLIGIIDELTT